MSENIELVSLKCSSCGASLDHFQGKTECRCDFCGNTTKILKPLKVSLSNLKLSEGDQGKFNNLIEIMQKALLAGNYKEAYDYCNKALEIDPSSGSLWENKAIATFLIRSEGDIIETEAKEIVTYLNTAKQCDGETESYKETAYLIAWNLYSAIEWRYRQIRPDESTDNGKTYTVYSDKLTRRIIALLNIMNLCFDIYPIIEFMEIPVNELTNKGKFKWVQVSEGKDPVNMSWCRGYSFDPLVMRNKMIAKAKALDPNFVVPEFTVPEKKTPNWVYIAGVVIVLFLLGKACH